MGKMVSVIVPVYNAEQYLGKCIESIMGQTHQNLQIILVNDGSTDGSGEICEKYANRDGRILLISKPNGGLTAARKTGLAKATGEYVAFIDADDWVEENYIDVLLDKIIETDADFVTSGYVEDRSYGEFTQLNLVPPGIYSDMYELVECIFDYQGTGNMGLHPVMWAKIYKAQFVTALMKTLQSDRMKLMEDNAALCWSVINAKKITVISDVLYHYVIHDGSLITAEDEEFLIKLSYIYLYIKRLFEQQPDREILLRKLDRWMVGWVITGINKKMGLSQKNLLSRYRLDESKLPQAERIVLYGAGSVGQAYHDQLIHSGKFKSLIWVDFNYEKYIADGLNVQPIERLRQKDWEYILVAVRDEKLYDNIRNMLVGEGYCAEEDLLWVEPIVAIDV